jgi:hypothetical protein
VDKEPTIEELKNMSQKEFMELMGKGTVRCASITEKCDLSAQNRRDEMRKQPMQKMYGSTGQGQMNRKKHPLGLGYLDDEGEEATLKSVVDERVERAKRAREQKEINDILAGLK